MVDLDRAADVQALREQGFDACYVGLVPESSQGMLDNIHAALAHKPLPGYEPEDAACLLLQVTTLWKARSTSLLSLLWPVGEVVPHCECSAWGACMSAAWPCSL